MASSSCECWPERQTVCIRLLHHRAAASLLDWSERSLTTSMQSKEEGCEADVNCLPLWSALAIPHCQQRLLPSSLLLHRSRQRALQPIIEQACGSSSVQGGCKLFALLATTRLPPLCFALELSGISPTSRASLWVVTGRWCECGCKLFACLAGTRRSCLPTKAATFLFALHRSRQRSLQLVIEQACS